MTYPYMRFPQSLEGIAMTPIEIDAEMIKRSHKLQEMAMAADRLMVAKPGKARPFATADVVEALREMVELAESLAEATHVNRGERAAIKRAAKLLIRIDNASN